MIAPKSANAPHQYDVRCREMRHWPRLTGVGALQHSAAGAMTIRIRPAPPGDAGNRAADFDQ